MSITGSLELICDICGVLADVTVYVHEGERVLRREAKSEGWSRRLQGVGVMVDLCPVHKDDPDA